MPFLVSSVSTFALSVIYCLYQGYLRDRQRRRRRLRERIAWMLWSAATQPDSCAAETR
jgi:hypothetical protein